MLLLAGSVCSAAPCSLEAFELACYAFERIGVSRCTSVIAEQR